jgi:hypothetical protein
VISVVAVSYRPATVISQSDFGLSRSGVFGIPVLRSRRVLAVDDVEQRVEISGRHPASTLYTRLASSRCPTVAIDADSCAGGHHATATCSSMAALPMYSAMCERVG